MTYLSHIIRISRLLEKLGEEKSKSAAGSGSGSASAAEALEHLRAFVDGVCDTVNALLIRFACETKDEAIDAEVSEWDILTKEGVDAAQDVSAAIFSQLLDTIRGYDENRHAANSPRSLPLRKQPKSDKDHCCLRAGQSGGFGRGRACTLSSGSRCRRWPSSHSQLWRSSTRTAGASS